MALLCRIAYLINGVIITPELILFILNWIALSVSKFELFSRMGRLYILNQETGESSALF